ncbi:hypothetical protein BABINDRAFT_61569 [Babjeviella inositovora NRRL Y-12698]|uniref:PH domain-containing protein n=1 Tax=Babjeviella inositovora NRRL Y-12698 TaxID=984486 RepID=A0A1E3QTJ2_9ASCO|nr:uncharacterized protein BABINDRAFT_61569 [Babjeviella inositovora NRRL Y-12698]ODQ80342.1 hypothetical protein BABINDRAFT_61569 [Babjeviella inositovora NRRL Y-12698]
MTESDAPRLLKLISVAFKEASLDSPTFRASINHHDRQIEDMELWIDNLLKLIRRFPAQVNEFKEFTNTMVEHLVPSFINEGLVDQDYTVRALQTSANGMRSLWRNVLSFVQISTNEATNELLQICAQDIRHYKRLKVQFDALQEKYNVYLETYNSHPKFKSPEMLMEDAQQLYRVRKQYMHAALDLVVCIAHLSQRLDSTLVRFSSSLWKLNEVRVPKPGETLDKEALDARTLARIQAWRDSLGTTRATLEGIMAAAREQIENSTLAQMRPSRTLTDYDSATINARSWLDYPEKNFEKHGYLFMLTSLPGLPGETWVKRWAFLKSGIFGLLLLAPSQTYVQETDKLGVLGCNVRYAPEQVRKFCFEVKTAESRFIFQTETLKDLKSWLKIFAKEKQRIIDTNDETEMGMALARYPPLLLEFASSAMTTSDAEWTSTNNIAQLSDLIASKREVLEEFENLTKPTALINSPISTDISHAALLARMFVSPSVIPTAITANLWGSVNWGIYFLIDKSSLKKIREIDTAISHDSMLISTRTYPANYPQPLRAVDVKMKALFETVVEDGEVALFEFKSLLSPNPSQELSGTNFVTQDHLYFYGNTMGFVFLAKCAIADFVSIESYATDRYDVLKIYDCDGLLIKTKVFLDDARVLKAKLKILMNEKVRDEKRSLEPLITDLDKAEKESVLRAVHPPAVIDSIPSVVSASSPVQPSNFKTDYSSRDVSLRMEKVYDIPPKAMFHILFGDSSTILTDVYHPIREHEISRTNWRRVDGDLLQRTVYSKMDLNKDNLGYIKTTYTIESLVENKYYNVRIHKASWKVPFCAPAPLDVRFVILSVNNKHSRLYAYSHVQFTKSLFFSHISRVLASATIQPTLLLIHKRLLASIEDIGGHGKILKAIKIYGQISKYEGDGEEGFDRPEYNQGSVITLSAIVSALVRQVLVFVVTLILNFGSLLYTGLSRLVDGLRMNVFLVALLTVSCCYNLFLTGKTTASYWSARKAVLMFEDYKSSEPNYAQRAIYLRDAEELVTSLSGVNGNASRCMAKFKENSFVLNFEAAVDWGAGYSDYETCAVARALKQRFNDIGIQRNDLLIRLRMLNRLEEEVAIGEWNNWLIGERNRCRLVRTKFMEDGFMDAEAEDVADRLALVGDILEYCQSCDFETLQSLLL